MSLSDIVNIQKKRNRRQKDLFKNIYEKIKIRINYYANYGKTNCQYEIPFVIYGYPLLNRELLSNQLEKKLKEEGFIVVNMDNGILWISWEETVIKFYKKKKKTKEKTVVENIEDERDEELMNAIAKMNI